MEAILKQSVQPRPIRTSISQSQWDELVAVVNAHQRFLLTTHVKPDGDGLGSQIGLARFLTQLGKSVRVVNDSPLHPVYRFLDPDGLVQSFAEAEDELLRNPPEVAFIVDISSHSRLGALKDYMKSSKALSVCLDHHQPGGDESSVLNLIDVEAAATGEIVFRLVRQWPMPLSAAVAEPLYASILTDTGCFAHTNSTARVHRVAAELLDTGISHTEIYRNMFQRSSLARYKLLAHLMLNLETSREGTLAWMLVSMDLLSGYGITADELNHFAEAPRVIEGIEAIILFLEEEGEVKLSFRSKGRANVLQVAKFFGGGGHQHASGARLPGTMEQVVDQVLPVAAETVGRQLGVAIALPAPWGPSV
jgi:bifunctional oligoribonuclease and PAP phosphatase NrnA